MQDSGFAAPLFVRNDGSTKVLMPISLSAAVGRKFDEIWLQRLLFRHPDALPIAEIDDSFSGLIPLCMEMDTPAGPVDAVFMTSGGRLAILETKLWRNPEARRKVVAQILDYAKELANWDYSRLDTKVRQARKAAKEEFPGVAEWVARTHPDLVQHRFQDAVTKSLAKGDFLLLIAGDGIREGVGAIAQYLDRNGSLHFTFGLVECAVYENPDGGYYVHPRVLAQTTKLVRTILTQPDGRIVEVEAENLPEQQERPDLVESREKYQRFWGEFLMRIRVEAAQPIPDPARSTNQFFTMPKGSEARISAYLGQATSKAGVYLQFLKGGAGERIYDALLRDRAVIDDALGVKVEWRTREKENQNWVIVDRTFPGVLIGDARTVVQEWLVENTERFISVFRPRIERLLREQG